MFKARMIFKKEGRAKYISHLDQMKALQRSIARANLEVWHTEGFNPHPYISIALPLSTGFSSEYEIMEFNFLTDDVPQDAVCRMNSALPSGIEVVSIYKAERKVKEIKFSKYEIKYEFDNGRNCDFVNEVTKLLNNDKIFLIKRTKRSEKEVNIKEFIAKFNVYDKDDYTSIVDVITAAGDPNLSPEYITKAINRYLEHIKFDGVSYHRKCVYDIELNKFV